MESELNELIVIGESDSSNIINPQTLLNIVLRNKKSEIDDIIKKSTKEILNHKYKDYENKHIILIGCTNKNVTRDTLNILCKSIVSHFGRIDCYDENWYKWEPLHYVARIADPGKLQVLLDNSVRVNNLTTFSENALHVLLEYQQCVKPFNTVLYNGNKSNDCMIVNVEKDNVFDCASKLIQAGIDVNHSNLWNETPICIAVRYRYVRITELLLKIPNLDIDTYNVHGLTIRGYLKEKHICQNPPFQANVLYEDPVKILFNYLKSGNEEALINFNNGNIKDYVNSVDGDSEFNTSGNMLQFCFKKGYFEYLQHELYSDKLTDNSITHNLMFETFCSKGLGKCIEHLLSNGANSKLTYRKFPHTLLETAAILGYYPFIAMLLQHKACKITIDDIFEILPKLYERQHYLINHEYYRKCVLSLLLNKLLILKKDEIFSCKELGILNNILHKLNLEDDDEKEDDSENICQILKLGACLTEKMENNEMIVQSIHPEILKLHFDDSIENNLFCYNSVVEDNSINYSETKALYFLANNSEKCELLRHPLLVHFIHNKWLRTYYFFYINLFLYFMFLLSIYVYMVSSHVKYSGSTINTVFYFLLVLHVVKECIQLYLYRLKYFFDSSNYLELVAIVSSTITIFYWNEYSAVVAILFSTVIFVMLVGQVPMCAKYTIIFGSTKYFLQYAGFYFIQFISFALVFYIIFPFKTNVPQDNSSTSNSTEFVANATTSKNKLKKDITDPIGDIFKSLFYTLILFTGEYNDRVLEPDGSPIFGRVIMSIFIFCMTIILNNLLVGLIVADMNEMQRTSKLHKQVKIANFIARMNSIAKRLYEFKTNIFIGKIINYFHIFKKGENKILDLSNCNHTSIFDDEDRKYLKSIKKGTPVYNKNLLINVYTTIRQKVNEEQKGKSK